MKITTQTQVREMFWNTLNDFSPELAKERRVNKRQNDYCPDVRCSFVDFVDGLQKQGLISEKLANKVTL